MPGENQILIEVFSLKEIGQINQLVADLHKMRKIDKTAIAKGFFKKRKSIKEQLDLIAEQTYYYICDFIIASGWQADRNKIETLWKFLKTQLS